VNVSYVITEACVGTKARNCVEVCPVDCTYDAGDQYLINPEECMDCGACEPECPAEAIYPLDEDPEEMKAYITKAARFDFSGIEPG
jgi:NAD-dependent dihydropyrimidine dehydrogenase PreA subunit